MSVSTRRATACVVVVAAAMCASAATAALNDSHTRVINFAKAPLAPKSAKSAFTQRGGLLPASVTRTLKYAQTRRIAVDVFHGGQAVRLFVAPGARRTWCFAWAEQPAPGSWIDEFAGCGLNGQPMIVAFDDTRIDIVASLLSVGRVLVKLSDGTVVQPALHWVSAPINAGILLYQPPTGVNVVEVTAMSGTSVVSKQTITPISTP